MSLSDDVKAGVDDVLAAAWSTRDGTVVPTTDDIVLKNGAVNIDATYLYADLADSSSLGQKVKKTVAAKVVRSYLNVATRMLSHYNGEIRSFDGDRVMAIFVGDSKNSDATRAALALNWAVDYVLAPKFADRWPSLAAHWETKHGIGIDTGKAMLVRGGVRSHNDLISIGSSPNVAAKLSELRCAAIHVTSAVYNRTQHKTASSGETRWTTHGAVTVASTQYDVKWSNWRWAPP